MSCFLLFSPHSALIWPLSLWTMPFADMETNRVTIFSCIRLRYLTVFTETPNPTQALFDIDRWSTLEAASSIFCACMPTLRQMIVSVVSLGRKRLGKRHTSDDGGGKERSSSTVALGINSRSSRSTDMDVPIDALKRQPKTAQEKLPNTEQPTHLSSDQTTFPNTEQPIHLSSDPIPGARGVRSGNSSIMYTVEYSVEVDTIPSSLVTPDAVRLSPPPYTDRHDPHDLRGVNDGCENYRACVVSHHLERLGDAGGSLRRQSRSPRLRVAA